MCTIVPPQVYETLKNVVQGNIENFEITVHDPNKKGEGYLGEMVFVTLENKNSDEVLDLVVKQAFTNKDIRDNHPIRNVYVNEVYFYAQVWTRLNKFQERIPSQCQFQKLAKYYTSILDDDSEKIVFENLKFQNFEIHDKKVLLDKYHFELIFKEYGKFHALSFAYKELHPDDYADLTTGIQDLYTDFINRDGFAKALKIINEIAMECLQPGIDDAAIEKFKPYLEDFMRLFEDSLEIGKYSVITHGDCWSNNMMFKYSEDRKLLDVRFLDFQLSKVGSPCCDLSYALYSGAPKEVLQDFDHYLRIYHDSLSETLRAFGCNPEKIYPFQELRNDWKKYCKLGIMMGLMILKVKYTYEENLVDLSDMKKGEEAEKAYYTGYDKDTFNKICRDLLLHLYENDFL